jgi:hypothetical protein
MLSFRAMRRIYQGVASSTMSSGLLDVMVPGSGDPFGQPGIHLTDDPTGHSHHQGLGRHLHSFRNHGTRRNDAAGSDHDLVKQDASHRDETIVTDRAAMQYHAMPDAYPPPYGAGDAFIHVHDGAVLDVGLGTNNDGRHVAPNDRVIPDAGILTQGDVSHDNSGGRYKG